MTRLRRKVQQYRKARCSLDQCPDRRAPQPKDEFAIPVAGYCSILNTGRPFADEDLQAFDHRRACLRPWPRPFHCTRGPAIVLPPGVAMLPASRSCRYDLNIGFTVSLAGLGRLAARHVWPHCASVHARSSRPLVQAVVQSPARLPHERAPAQSLYALRMRWKLSCADAQGIGARSIVTR